MAYIIKNNQADSGSNAEIIALKKQIAVLTTANTQLKAEMETYKQAYERYKNIFIIKAVRKILKKDDD